MTGSNVLAQEADITSAATRPRTILALCGHMVVLYGLELAFLENLREAIAGGFRVHAIVNDWENHRVVARLDEIGATWSTGSYGYAVDKGALSPSRALRTIRSLLRTNAQCVRDIRRVRPSVIAVPDHVILLRNAGALLYARLTGRRIVFSVANAPESKSLYRRLWRAVIARLVDDFVANSEFTAHELAEIGVPRHKITAVIPPAAPIRATPAGAKQGDRDWRRVVYVGQVIPPKGLHLLLDAIAILAAGGRDIFLDVVGPIDGWESATYAGYRDKLLARAALPDLTGRVRFHGYVTNVPEILAGAGVHCFPSLPEIREAFGIVTLEAKQAGIPSVGFQAGAFPEMVTHAKDGWIASEVSAEGLAEGIAHFFDDRACLEAAGAAAKKSAERFREQQMTKPWLALYTRAVR